MSSAQTRIWVGLFITNRARRKNSLQQQQTINAVFRFLYPLQITCMLRTRDNEELGKYKGFHGSFPRTMQPQHVESFAQFCCSRHGWCMVASPGLISFHYKYFWCDGQPLIVSKSSFYCPQPIDTSTPFKKADLWPSPSVFMLASPGRTSKQGHKNVVDFARAEGTSLCQIFGVNPQNCNNTAPESIRKTFEGSNIIHIIPHGVEMPSYHGNRTMTHDENFACWISPGSRAVLHRWYWFLLERCRPSCWRRRRTRILSCRLAGWRLLFSRITMGSWWSLCFWFIFSINT